MKRYLLRNSILSFLFLFSSFTLAQQKTNEEILQGFDDYVNKVMSDWKVQGCAVAIVKNGTVIYTKGYGLRDAKNNLPATENTLFAIGSCTKAFTSTAVCILVDQGQIDLDKPVINYIPTFKMFDDYVTLNMTPRDLMCHRSGLPRHDLAWYGSDLTRKEIFDRLRYLEPSKPFRTTFQYQNGMFMAAGYLVEQVSSKTWEEFVKENIMTPLEMNNTNFSIYDMQKRPDFSKPYRESKTEVKEIPFRNIDAMGPAGSINSSVKEMGNWVIMQLGGGKFKGKEIVSSSSINEMHTPQMVNQGGFSKDVFYHSYGLGWDITSFRGHLRVEHGGNIDGFSADVALYPTDTLGIVVLTNMDGSQFPSVVRNNAAERFMGLDIIDWSERLLGDRKRAEETINNEPKEDKDRIPDTHPSHELKDYAGTYENPAYGKLVITFGSDKLSFSFHGFESALKHYHYDVFQAESEELGGIKLNFVSNGKGQVDKVTSPLEPSVKEIEFIRAAEIKYTDVNKYIGTYELAGMDVTVSKKGDNTLALTVPGQPTYTLVPDKEDVFNIKDLNGYSVSFTMDGSKVTEIIFHQPNGNFTAKKK